MKVQSRTGVFLLMALVLLMVAVAAPATAKPPADGQVSVGGIEFIGSTEFVTGYQYGGTEVGGLSGIVYDKWQGVYHALSDDKSEVNDARFYSLTIDLGDGTLDDGDIEFVDVTYLTDANGDRFALDTLDPEGFELVRKGALFIGSERDLENQPWIKRFDLGGMENMTLPLPDYYLVDGVPQTSGVYTNLAFESLTVSPNFRHLYAATENAMAQDGPKSTIDLASPSRVLEYRLKGNAMRHVNAAREFVYMVDPIPYKDGDRFADMGLVEMEALDNFGTFLAMERSFASGIGNTILLYETSFAGATDVSGVADLDDVSYVPMDKELVLAMELGEYEGITLDNMEGMVLGPRMKDGRYPLIIVADNNFNDPWQRTLFMAFAVELERN